MLRWLKNKLRPQPQPEPPFAIAREEDIYYCYRLFLQREPDQHSAAWWHKEVTSHPFPLQQLIDGFLFSAEFQRLYQEAGRSVLVELDGFRIYARPNDFSAGAAIVHTKMYEPHVTAELRRLLQPGMVFVDLGANIGYFSLLAASLVGPQGKVIAFEPNTDNCDLIRQSITANNFQQVYLHPYAAAEKAQTFTLDVAGRNSNGRIIDYTSEAVPGINPIRTIEAVALDDFLAGEARIDVIKLDIEGAEPRAWQGMARLIEKHRPFFLLEFSPFLIEVTSHLTPAAFLDAIFACGYQLFILAEGQPKSEQPQDKAALLAAAAQLGQSHLDLIAYPPGKHPSSSNPLILAASFHST